MHVCLFQNQTLTIQQKEQGCEMGGPRTSSVMRINHHTTSWKQFIYLFAHTATYNNTSSYQEEDQRPQEQRNGFETQHWGWRHDTRGMGLFWRFHQPRLFLTVPKCWGTHLWQTRALSVHQSESHHPSPKIPLDRDWPGTSLDLGTWCRRNKLPSDTVQTSLDRVIGGDLSQEEDLVVIRQLLSKTCPNMKFR